MVGGDGWKQEMDRKLRFHLQIPSKPSPLGRAEARPEVRGGGRLLMGFIKVSNDSNRRLGLGRGGVGVPERWGIKPTKLFE